jgi:hypothetical protein
MRALILYWHPLGSPARSSVSAHLAALGRVVGDENAAFVNTVGGAHRSLAKLDVDCVILHTTFLGMRWTTPFAPWRERSSWIGRLGVPVLAFPQDDYDHAHVLDEWLAELGTTDVFSALAEHVDSLYPTRAGGARFHPVLTGYLDRPARQSARGLLRDRALDVVYRATSLPYWFGSHGQLKGRIGEEAAAEAKRLSLRHDVSVAPGSVIAGEAWMRFLGSGRATVGSESGSSALDRRGELRRAVAAALREQPSASFEQVASVLPEGWDAHRFFVLSPRHLEAAATSTAQILVTGEYSGVLSAGRHYLPVQPDLSDLGDALEQARDPHFLQELVDRTYDEIVTSGRNASDVFIACVQQALRGRGCEPENAGAPPVSWRARRRAAVARADLAAWRRPGALVKWR